MEETSVEAHATARELKHVPSIAPRFVATNFDRLRQPGPRLCGRLLHCKQWLVRRGFNAFLMTKGKRPSMPSECSIASRSVGPTRQSEMFGLQPS